MKLWINAGELSGDMQAAELVKALQTEITPLEIVGMGGAYLQAVGVKCLFRVDEISVMGIVEVVSYLPKIISLLYRINGAIKKERPDAIILVDAADFNFFVARMAKHLNIPVYYFIPPKVWAWRTGRIQFLKKNIRKILSILPFEIDFYKQHGIIAEYVGNPLVSLVDACNVSSIKPISGRIGFMPGSRKKEVELLLPEFAKLAELIQSIFPHIEFYILRAPNFSEEYLRSYWSNNVAVHIQDPENRYEFMASCECIVAASGTATLETALVGVPTIVAYKVSPMTAIIAKKFLKVKYISLPNLIMGKAMFPEYIQDDASAENMALCLTNWLMNPSVLDAVRNDCTELKRLCDGGSMKKAAQVIFNDLKL